MEVLDLSEGGKVQKLDEELAGEVGLVPWESFNGDDDGGGGDNEGVQGVDSRGWEEGKSDRLRVGQGRVGRFVSARGREIWHSYSGGLDR